jgi:hypothetical protein
MIRAKTCSEAIYTKLLTSEELQAKVEPEFTTKECTVIFKFMDDANQKIFEGEVLQYDSTIQTHFNSTFSKANKVLTYEVKHQHDVGTSLKQQKHNNNQRFKILSKFSIIKPQNLLEEANDINITTRKYSELKITYSKYFLNLIRNKKAIALLLQCCKERNLFSEHEQALHTDVERRQQMKLCKKLEILYIYYNLDTKENKFCLNERHESLNVIQTPAQILTCERTKDTREQWLHKQCSIDIVNRRIFLVNKQQHIQQHIYTKNALDKIELEQKHRELHQNLDKNDKLEQQRYTKKTTHHQTFEVINFYIIIGPFESTDNIIDFIIYILIMNTDLSKYIILTPLQKKDADIIIEVFNTNILSHYGRPPRNIEIEFINEELKNWCKTIGVIKTKNTLVKNLCSSNDLAENAVNTTIVNEYQNVYYELFDSSYNTTMTTHDFYNLIFEHIVILFECIRYRTLFVLSNVNIRSTKIYYSKIQQISLTTTKRKPNLK